MSVSIDPAKKTYVPPSTTPTVTPTKSEKPTLKMEPPENVPAPSLGQYFALSGAGVAGKVFGPKFPDPRKMSTDDLAAGVQKMEAAIRKNPGLVNEADLKLHGAMVLELATREQLLLDDKTPVDKLTNGQLFHELVAFDLAKQSGAKLTPEQEKRYGDLSAAMKSRKQNDLSGEIAKLETMREELGKSAAVHCGAAVVGGFGLVFDSKAAGALATTVVAARAISEGKYGDALTEVGLYGIGLYSHTAEKIAEGVATAKNAQECLIEVHELQWTTKALDELKAKAGAK